MKYILLVLLLSSCSVIDEYPLSKFKPDQAFTGVGITFTQYIIPPGSKNIRVYISKLVCNGPAYQAGLKAGDEVLSINGHDTRYQIFDTETVSQGIKRNTPNYVTSVNSISILNVIKIRRNSNELIFTVSSKSIKSNSKWCV